MREPLAIEQLETVSTTNDPLAEAIRRADLAALWRAIEALPRQQRDALLLREFGGLSYGELSAALAVSGAAVESLLFRARHRLRGQLRTVYASVSGASWIDALVRLFAGGSAPVAAKVAVLGVGAAVVGSTAVVVPNVLDNHQPRTQRTPAAVVHRSKHHQAPLLVERVVTAPTRTPAYAQVTLAPIVRVSSEHGAGQDAPEASQHAQGGEHAARAETSNDQADRSGSGDGGDLSGSNRHGDGQKGDGGDGSSTTIPVLPALPPLPSPPSGDDGGN
jgi:Sigma-70, region 4